MLAGDGVKLLDFHLPWHGFLVLGGSVEMTGTSGRFQFDLVTHVKEFSSELTLQSRFTQLGENDLDAFLVDQAKSRIGDAKTNPAVLTFQPKTTILQIG